MTKTAGRFFCLATTEPADALAGQLGKLELARTAVQDPVPFEVLDTFDGAVRGMGGVLLRQRGVLRVLLDGPSVLEQAEDSDAIFVTDMDDGPVRAALDGVSALRSLRPVADGKATHQSWAAMDRERKTQVRLDILVLEPAGQGAGMSLVVAQGLRGYGKALKRVCSALENQPQVADAQALLCPEFTPHSAKPFVPLAPTDTAFHAACDLIKAHIPVAQATEPGNLADYNSEYLHDYRVALRKIRSVLSLFHGVFSDQRSAELKARFSALMEPTGRLRDLDVYVLEKDLYFDMLPDSLHPGLLAMFDVFQIERAKELARLSRHLRSAAYHREIDELGALFIQPDRLQRGPMAMQLGIDYARRLIWKRYRKVCKIARAIDASTEDEEVHDLRIHCKKLRYLMEFFAACFPRKDIKALIKALKRLQDNLGLFNDYSVQQDSLRDFLDTHGRMRRDRFTAIAQTIGALIAILHQRQTDERDKVVENFGRFDSKDVQDMFRRLFKAQGGHA